MHLNIAQKIFGIAAVVLFLMLAVAVYSIRLTAGISDDLGVIAGKQMPLSEAVERINVHILQQGVVMQRLFVRAEEHANLHVDASRFMALGKEINEEFSNARRLIKSEERAAPAIGQALKVLEKDIASIEREYLVFEDHGRLLVEAEASGKRALFDNLLPAFNSKQDALDSEIANLRRHVEEQAGDAVLRADKDEFKLLVINSALTALAALLAIAFAGLVTRALVRSVRNLVSGAEAIEAGHLDTEVPITTHDEVGRLTGSFNSMVGGLRLKERIQNTFGKYMDPRIVSNLLDHPELTEPGGEKREMTVMFIDLKGFTSISEKLSPPDLVKLVNDFFTLMTEAISANNGVVDKYMGDAVMAYWGAPFSEPDEHAELACRAALEALRRLETFRDNVNKELGEAAEGLDIDLRIGVSTGDMIVGTIGSKASMNFTVMGDPVNLGSRLEGASKAYGTRVLISERTNELAGEGFMSREIDMIRVKGKLEPTRIYELMGEQATQLALPTPAMDSFTAGIAAYRGQKWDQAETAFRACLDLSPEDPPSGVYLQRIGQLKEKPPPSNWDGVWVFETK